MQNEEIFHLPEGAVVLRYPVDLSPESVVEMKERLGLAIKAAERKASLPAGKKSQPAK